MSQAIVKKGVEIEIAEKISRGEITTADDITVGYGVSYNQALLLLSSPRFIQTVSAMSKAKAVLAWHSMVIPKLIGMVESKEDKTSLSAMKMLGQFTDSIKGGGFEVNINLEGLVKESEEKNVSNNLIQKNQVDNVFDLEEYRKVING